MRTVAWRRRGSSMCCRHRVQGVSCMQVASRIKTMCSEYVSAWCKHGFRQPKGATDELWNICSRELRVCALHACAGILGGQSGFIKLAC